MPEPSEHRGGRFVLQARALGVGIAAGVVAYFVAAALFGPDPTMHGPHSDGVFDDDGPNRMVKIYFVAVLCGLVAFMISGSLFVTRAAKKRNEQSQPAKARVVRDARGA